MKDLFERRISEVNTPGSGLIEQHIVGDEIQVSKPKILSKKKMMKTSYKIERKSIHKIFKICLICVKLAKSTFCQVSHMIRFIAVRNKFHTANVAKNTSS